MIGDKSTPRSTTFDQALRLLARRDHSEVELRRKLAQRGNERAEIEQTIVRLRELGYLDDSRIAGQWAREQAAKGGQGRRKALAKMQVHGLKKEVAESALEEAWNDDIERSHAEAVLRKLTGGGDGTIPEDRRERAKLARRLIGRGFDPSVVQALLDGHGTESGGED